MLVMQQLAKAKGLVCVNINMFIWKQKYFALYSST